MTKGLSEVFRPTGGWNESQLVEEVSPVDIIVTPEPKTHRTASFSCSVSLMRDLFDYGST